MRMVLVRGSVVENVILAEPGFNPGDGIVMIPSEAAGPGWLYDGSGFRPPTIERAAVPAQIALWQARAALSLHGLLDAANAAVAASGDDVLRTVWEYGNVISRASPGLAGLASALGLDDAAVDDLFYEAASIEA